MNILRQRTASGKVSTWLGQRWNVLAVDSEGTATKGLARPRSPPNPPPARRARSGAADTMASPASLPSSAAHFEPPMPPSTGRTPMPRYRPIPLRYGYASGRPPSQATEVPPWRLEGGMTAGPVPRAPTWPQRISFPPPPPPIPRPSAASGSQGPLVAESAAAFCLWPATHSSNPYAASVLRTVTAYPRKPLPLPGL